MSKESKTLLYVHPFAQEISGPDESLLLLLRHLPAAQIQTLVWLPPNSPHRQRYLEAGAQLIERTTPFLRRSLSPAFLVGFVFQNIWATLRLCRLIRQRRIDLIHTNMESVLFSGVACRLCGVPSVYHVRGTSFFNPKWLGRQMVWLLNLLADRLICISESIRQLFVKHLDASVHAKVVRAYNPIDPDFFQPLSATPQVLKAWRQRFRWLVASISRINPRKDLETFLRGAALVAKRRDDVGFLVIGGAANRGESIYLEKLKDLANDLGLTERCQFAGAITPIRPAIESLDCVCLLSRSEGFGRTLAEAAACAKPTIGSNIDGIIEVIDHEQSGLLVPAGDATAFAAAIEHLLQDDQTLKRFGQAAREQAQQRFSVAEHVKIVNNLYADLLRSL